MGNNSHGSAASGVEASAAEARSAIERDAHAKEFTARTGLRPRACYRLILLSMSLRIIGGTWIAMVFLEYVRYYVINDMSALSTMETATESPLSLLKALMFPYWGVIADRVSRKSVLVAASVSSCVAAWLMSLMPSMGVFVLSRCLSLVADINGPIRDAVLRDLFTSAEWEHEGGGVTGIKSHMAVLGTVVAAGAVAVGMGLLSLGEFGLIALENEYSKRKEECKGQRHCVAVGSYSWDGHEWQMDGLLRLLMVMGAVAFSVETLLLLIWLPETLKREDTQKVTVHGFVKDTRRVIGGMGGPWNNLRVFATDLLRSLASIRFLHYAIASGGSALFLSWYRRHEMDTLSMYTLGTSGGVAAFVFLLLVIRLVKCFGDLRGIWIPANVLGLLYGASVALIPASHWQLSYIFFPLFGGPGAALAGFAPELLAKLVPPNVQGTFQTGKAFIFDFQRALLVWPWWSLLICSEKFPYPFDVLPIWVALVLGATTLFMTLKQLPVDPKKDIQEGRALDDFYLTSYAKGKWYQQHGGQLPAALYGPAPHDGKNDVTKIGNSDAVTIPESIVVAVCSSPESKTQNAKISEGLQWTLP